jgi:hypothetical protein
MLPRPPALEAGGRGAFQGRGAPRPVKLGSGSARRYAWDHY